MGPRRAAVRLGRLPAGPVGDRQRRPHVEQRRRRAPARSSTRPSRRSRQSTRVASAPAATSSSASARAPTSPSRWACATRPLEQVAHPRGQRQVLVGRRPAAARAEPRQDPARLPFHRRERPGRGEHAARRRHAQGRAHPGEGQDLPRPRTRGARRPDDHQLSHGPCGGSQPRSDGHAQAPAPHRSRPGACGTWPCPRRLPRTCRPASIAPGSRPCATSARAFPRRALREVPVVGRASSTPRRTPSGATRVWLALEALQVTGSFKVRGALVGVSRANTAAGPLRGRERRQPWRGGRLRRATSSTCR